MTRSARNLPRRPRADDDDDWYGPTFFGIGQAHAVAEADNERPAPAGWLLVPDPEQGSGWREHYVAARVTPKPGSRPIGFGRRGPR
jgi:hypothetical protein